MSYLATSNYSYDMKYTDNPYIDLLVYETKNMAANCIVKNEREALKYETLESRKASNDLISYKDGYPVSESFDPDFYTETNRYYRMLNGEPPLPTKEEIQAFQDENGVNADIWPLYESKYIPLDNYISTNPERDELETQIPQDQRFLHLAGRSQAILDLLEHTGVMDQIRNDYTTDDFKYIYHLGDKSIDPYTARKAENFSLLYVPKGKFDEIFYKWKRYYERNRVFTISTVYSEAFAFGSEHYDNFIVIFIILQTMIDIISEVQEYIINNDVFDSRTIRYLFESYGIEYYKEIPIKYQIAMIKNVHTLLKYKSSNRNIVDICSLFGFPDINVFTYYLLKIKNKSRDDFDFYEESDITVIEFNRSQYSPKDQFTVRQIDKLYQNNNRYELCVSVDQFPGYKSIGWVDNTIIYNYAKDNNVPITEGMTVEIPNGTPVYSSPAPKEYVTEDMIGTEKQNQNYDLKFLKVPINEVNASKYMEDVSLQYSYEDIVEKDPFWDGRPTDTASGNDLYFPQDERTTSEKLKKEILDENFSCVRTKYISVDAAIDITQLSYQTMYFMNIIYDKTLTDKFFLELDGSIVEQANPIRSELSHVFILATSLQYLYNGIEPRFFKDMESNLYINGFNFESDWTDIYNDLQNITVRDDNGNKVIVKYGFLTELNSSEIDPQYSEGAFLSGRYKNDSGNYSSLVWHDLQNKKIHDMSETYSDYTYNGIGGYNYPTYLQPALETGYYSIDNLGVDEFGDYHYIDISWSTPYDPSQNSEADFLRWDNVDEWGSDLSNFDALKKMYLTNTKLYDHLVYMMNHAENKHMYDIYYSVFKSFMITKTSNQIFDGYDTPIDFLEDKDPVLYSVYQTASNISNNDERRSYISNICDYISYALEKYFDSDEWKYVYNIIPTHNLEFIQKCILKVIIFFKSWKTQMLDQTVQYVIDNKFSENGNYIQILDDISRRAVINGIEKVRPYDYPDFLVKTEPRDYASPKDKIHFEYTNGMYVASEDDFVWYEINEEVYLVRYIGEATIFRVASTFEGNPVRYISESCFGWCDIEHVVLPDGVKTIEGSDQ